MRMEVWYPINFIQFIIYLFTFSGADGGEYCTVTAAEYCEYGCCGIQCCPNKIAIGVGTTLGGIVGIIIIAGVIICFIQRRYNRPAAVPTRNIGTQTDKNPVPGKNAGQGRQERRPTLPQPPPPAVFSKKEETSSELNTRIDSVEELLRD